MSETPGCKASQNSMNLLLIIVSTFAGEKISNCAFPASHKNVQMPELEEATLIFNTMPSVGVLTMC